MVDTSTYYRVGGYLGFFLCAIQVFLATSCKYKTEKGCSPNYFLTLFVGFLCFLQGFCSWSAGNSFSHVGKLSAYQLSAKHMTAKTGCYGRMAKKFPVYSRNLKLIYLVFMCINVGLAGSCKIEPGVQCSGIGTQADAQAHLSVLLALGVCHAIFGNQAKGIQSLS